MRRRFRAHNRYVGSQVRIEPDHLRRRLDEATREFQSVQRADLFPHIPLSADPRTESTRTYFESYFSNITDGDTIQAQEGYDILHQQKALPRTGTKRQDVLALRQHYRLIQQPHLQLHSATTPELWQQAVKGLHGILLVDFPEESPGQYNTKKAPDTIGVTRFPDPEHYAMLMEHLFYTAHNSPAGLPRAAILLVGLIQIHPFVNGNGRISRILANIELSHNDNGRFIMHFDARHEFVHPHLKWYHGAPITTLVDIIARMQLWTQTYSWYDNIPATERQLEQDGYLIPKRKAGSIYRFPKQLPSLPDRAKP